MRKSGLLPQLEPTLLTLIVDDQHLLVLIVIQKFHPVERIILEHPFLLIHLPEIQTETALHSQNIGTNKLDDILQSLEVDRHPFGLHIHRTSGLEWTPLDQAVKGP
ncbi:MAG: hypothetical protein BWY82_02828 [Verrucomicrobia bacterium ADurb.Bin474]|nr:MAG: hypothetical protein BWY82_02828 [Verrucomicrobia bacterium ADurb.Bin474]